MQVVGYISNSLTRTVTVKNRNSNVFDVTSVGSTYDYPQNVIIKDTNTVLFPGNPITITNTLRNSKEQTFLNPVLHQTKLTTGFEEDFNGDVKFVKRPSLILNEQSPYHNIRHPRSNINKI